MTVNKSYSEMQSFFTFEERFDYLSLGGSVGASTFGFERWMNQEFYRSRDWRHIRQKVILRDEGCDLGVEGYEIHDRLLIHHINPLTPDAITNGDPGLIDLENLITTTHLTHNAIHYGDRSQLAQAWVPRRPGDTMPWRR